MRSNESERERERERQRTGAERALRAPTAVCVQTRASVLRNDHCRAAGRRPTYAAAAAAAAAGKLAIPRTTRTHSQRQDDVVGRHRSHRNMTFISQCGQRTCCLRNPHLVDPRDATSNRNRTDEFHERYGSTVP